MEHLAILCDVVGEVGGAERYWATVLPALARRYDVRLFGRVVETGSLGGVEAARIAWSDERSEPSPEAAALAADAIESCETVVTASVLDACVLEAVRKSGARWIVRIHDHRPFCPNGNKVFPQFPAICALPMGSACTLNTALRGCVYGPRRSSLEVISRRMQVRDAIARADAVIVSSDYMRRECLQNGIPERIVHVTPPPLADEFFRPMQEPQDRSVLFFGRATGEKGLPSLIRAIGGVGEAARPPLKVASQLSADQESAMRSLAAQRQVELTLLGWLSQDDLRKAIDSSRIVAVPSLWAEPFGLSGTQAQARSRPVVAYDVGGVREWIAGGGIAVRRGDEPALSEAISRLCSDDSLWSRLSARARENAQAYRLERHMPDLLDILSAPARSRIA